MKWILILALLLNSCAAMDVQRVTTCSYENGKHTCIESQPLVSGRDAISWGVLAVVLGAVLGTTLNNQ